MAKIQFREYDAANHVQCINVKLMKSVIFNEIVIKRIDDKLENDQQLLHQ